MAASLQVLFEDLQQGPAHASAPATIENVNKSNVGHFGPEKFESKIADCLTVLLCDEDFTHGDLSLQDVGSEIAILAHEGKVIFACEADLYDAVFHWAIRATPFPSASQPKQSGPALDAQAMTIT
jgi:hypothetical protein